MAQIATIAGKGPFKTYLESLSTPDRCYETAEFLKVGHSAATQRALADFITTAGKFSVGAKDLVFNEMPSHVVDKTGKPAKW